MEKRLTMIFAALFLCIGMALAQTKVSGIVTSAEDGEPVVGASVKVVGTNTGTVTNIDGQFQIQIANGAKLEISYIGMQTKTVKATPKMKIVLEPDNQSLDEVMVVAFGTAKKSAFTGSATVVDSKELGKKVTTNVAESLVGSVAGLQLRGQSGQPGTSACAKYSTNWSLGASQTRFLINPKISQNKLTHNSTYSQKIPPTVQNFSKMRQKTTLTRHHIITNSLRMRSKRKNFVTFY